MTEIDFSKIPDGTLLIPKEGAQYLGVTRRYFEQLELRGYFKRDTPEGVCPRYLFSNLKAFKERAYKTGFLPLLPLKGARDLADASISGDGFATAKEVARYLRITPATIYVRMKKGNFPKPVRFKEDSYPRWNVGQIRRYALLGMKYEEGDEKRDDTSNP